MLKQSATLCTTNPAMADSGKHGNWVNSLGCQEIGRTQTVNLVIGHSAWEFATLVVCMKIFESGRPPLLDELGEEPCFLHGIFERVIGCPSPYSSA